MRFVLYKKESWTEDAPMYEITNIIQSASWATRLVEFGEFQITVSRKTELAKDIVPGSLIYEVDSDTWGIVETISYDSSSLNLEVRGSSIETVLNRRITWNPASSSGGSKSYPGGTVSSMVSAILSDNVNGSNLTEARKFPNFQFSDQTVALPEEDPETLVDPFETVGEGVGDIIQKLCNEKTVGFRLDWTYKKLEDPLPPNVTKALYINTSGATTSYCNIGMAFQRGHRYVFEWTTETWMGTSSEDKGWGVGTLGTNDLSAGGRHAKNTSSMSICWKNTNYAIVDAGGAAFSRNSAGKRYKEEVEFDVNGSNLLRYQLSEVDPVTLQVIKASQVIEINLGSTTLSTQTVYLGKDRNSTYAYPSKLRYHSVTEYTGTEISRQWVPCYVNSGASQTGWCMYECKGPSYYFGTSVGGSTDEDAPTIYDDRYYKVDYVKFSGKDGCYVDLGSGSRPKYGDSVSFQFTAGESSSAEDKGWGCGSNTDYNKSVSAGGRHPSGSKNQMAPWVFGWSQQAIGVRRTVGHRYSEVLTLSSTIQYSITDSDDSGNRYNGSLGGPTLSSSWVSANNMYIGKDNSDKYAYPSANKVHDFSITRSGNTLVHLVPVYDRQNGRYGLLDIAHSPHVMYYSVNSSADLTGPEVSDSKVKVLRFVLYNGKYRGSKTPLWIPSKGTGNVFQSWKSIKSSKNHTNAFYIRGEDEYTTSGKVSSATDDDVKGYSRKESYFDYSSKGRHSMSSTDYANVLKTAAGDEIKKMNRSNVVEFELGGTHDEFRNVHDWLGSTVDIYDEGEIFRVRVMEIIRKLESGVVRTEVGVEAVS